MIPLSRMAFAPRAHLDRMKAKAGAKVAEECPALVQVSFLDQLCRMQMVSENETFAWNMVLNHKNDGEI